MSAVGEQRNHDDLFVIIGARYPDALKEIDETWPGAEVLAPVEKKMVRPRRKSSKKKAHYISRPLFYEYMALRWSDVSEAWERTFSIRSVWFVLLGCNGVPLLFRRNELGGMNRGDTERSWEGAKVEFLQGPMKGRTGIYRNGHVEIELFSTLLPAKVNVFDLLRL